MAKHVAEKLAALAPLFSDILHLGGGVGMSLGVLHHGEVIHTAHFGQQAIGSSAPPNDDTLYYVASLTKAITAASTAILVEKHILEWDTPLAEYLPEFKQRDDDVGRQATLIDVLSHRTGLTGANALWIQRKQKFMMPKDETVRTAAYIDATMPFRSGFQYNNWGYGLATALIEKVTGQTYGTFVRRNIFEPLTLKRITLDVPGFDNVASANMVYDDGSPCQIRTPPNSDLTGLAGAGGAKTSLSDLLHLYKSLLSQYTIESSGNEAAASNSPSPFRQVRNLFEGRIGIGNASIAKNSYALGWVKAVLPERLGIIGMNTGFIGPENMPVIGKNSPGVTVLYHHGNLVGAISSAHLIPETETAIVVMSNTMGLSDTTDWIGQLVLQTILEEEPHDYVQLSKSSKEGSLQQFASVIEELKQGKTDIPPSQRLEAYCGRYYNAIGNFVLEITLQKDGEGLIMMVQDLDEVVYELISYDKDSFYWPCDREEELCNQMMFPWTWAGVHKIEFDVTEEGDVRSLTWKHDSLASPEVFRRQTNNNSIPQQQAQHILGNISGKCSYFQRLHTLI